jgi:catechol 2,3-dioxygenase-like lactoylglutathione lyase family enzyme
MILDHFGFSVADVERSKRFYVEALAPLGIAIVMEGHGWVGMGRDGRPQFWFGGGGKGAGPIHLAFAARSRAEVRAFYEAALAAGGKDNGAPGVRPEYHPDYYGAFVIDPDGHNMEAVCHTPER